jgi:hypothetical protein
MDFRKKGLAFIIFLFLIPLNFAQTTIQVEQQQPVEKTNWLSSAFSFLKSPIFWGIVITILIAVLIIVALFFIIKAIIKYFKQRNNIFWQMRSARIKLAKVHRSYPSKHFFKVYKNTPIRLVRKNNDKLTISEPIGYHRGNYTSHEGNVIIAMNMKGNKKLWTFPITDLLIIPNRDKVEITQKSKEGKISIVTINNIPKASEIVQFGESEILLFAESISNIGTDGNEFYVPVLKTKDNKILDFSMPVFQTLKEVVLQDYMIAQTDEFSKLAKKSMDINPTIRGLQRIGDNNNTVEIPSENST